MPFIIVTSLDAFQSIMQVLTVLEKSMPLIADDMLDTLIDEMLDNFNTIKKPDGKIEKFITMRVTDKFNDCLNANTRPVICEKLQRVCEAGMCERSRRERDRGLIKAGEGK